MSTPGLTRLSAVAGEATPLTALVTTDQRTVTNPPTASVKPVTVTVATVSSARVLTVENSFTLGFTDLILGALVAFNCLEVSTWKCLLYLYSASGCRAK